MRRNTRQNSSWLRSGNPALVAAAQQLQSYLARDIDPYAKARGVAQIVTPILDERIQMEDFWATVLDEQDWTGTPIGERVFRLPNEILGAKQVISYQNGVVLPIATLGRRTIQVAQEEIAPPAFPVDTRELNRSDAVVTVEDITDAATRMITIHKARRGYFLMTDGFVDNDETLEVVIDDGTYDSGTSNPAFLKVLRDLIESQVMELQDTFSGRPQLNILARQLTFDRLSRVGLNPLFPNLPQGTNEDNRRIVTNPSLRAFTFPAGTDDPNDVRTNTAGRPIFTEGDVLLIAPGAGALARTEPLDPSTIERDHWMVEYAWRLAHSWVRWADKGDRSRIRRILYIKEVAAGATAGTWEVDELSTTGAVLYCTRPIDVDTISNSTVVISASSGGAQATGALTKNLRGDLRHLELTFATPLTAGTTYYITTTTTAKDLAGDDITALAEVVMVAK